MKMYDLLKKSLKEMQQPLSQGEKNFKGLHNPVDHTNLVPGVTDQEHVFNGVTKPQENNFPNSNKSGEDSRGYDPDITLNDADKVKGYDASIELNKEEVEQVDEKKWIAGAIKKPGSLHKELGVPEGEKIPADKLAAASHAPGKLGKRARLAQTLKKIHKEQVEQVEEERTDTYIGTVHRDDPDYEKKVGEMKKKAVGGHRIRGRAPKDEYKHLYKKGGELHRMTSQDIKPEHASRVDVYSRKPMKEEVEQVEEANQYIEVKNKHTGAVRHVEVHPSRAFEALNKHKDKNHTARIVTKKPMKNEEVELDEVLSKKASIGSWISDFVHSKNPKFAGKSKKERMKQAMAAYYSKQRNEAYSDNDYMADEVSMVRTELKAIIAKAQDMMDKMPTDMHIEPWVQSKIATAKEMVSGVHDYMVYGDDKDTAPTSAAAYSQSGQMASNYGNFMNRMGEEVELDEAKRGRPRKNASTSDSDVEGGADMHPMMQARKAISLRGQHTFTHRSGESYKMEPSMAHKILAHHDNLKTAEQKQEFSDRVAHSKAEMHNALAGKPAVKKPKVSLGSMKKEDADPTTKQWGRGAMEVKVINGRPTFTKAAKKEIKVEELVGGQKKLDANHNGKIDKMDFKILRARKKTMKEAEEMTAANVAKAAATQVAAQAKGDAGMQKDSIKNINKDPLAKKTNEEIDTLDRLFDSLSESNQEKFRSMIETEEGLDYLLNFANEQGV